jgi:hypothetical protein
MRGLLGLLILAAVVMGGCGATGIDDKKTEDYIAKRVREQVGAAVKSVSCPSGLTAKKGETFECTVTAPDGTTGKATVTEKDDEGRVSVAAPFIHMGDIEQGIASRLGDQTAAADVTVSCPEIVEGEKGGVFECDAVSGPDKAVIEVTQTDGLGHVNFKVKR